VLCREASSMRGKVVVAVLVLLLATAGRASAEAPRSPGRYTVRAGDSLSAIAQHYHVSLVALAHANRLDWQQTLLIGVVLRLPTSGSGGSSWAGTYIVRPGDTLSGIALRYHVSLGQLAAANAFDPAKVLLIGTRLRLPTGGAAPLDLTHLVEHNPYRSGQVGIDVSYPNCAAPLPGTHGFAVIGLNAGRPFTTNPCFADEWAAAGPPRSLYINTAYSPTLARHITPDCAAAAAEQSLGPATRRAYMVGCSEGAAALAQLGGTTAEVVWLDIEPGNSWSSRRMLNAAAIRGILEQLLTHSPPPTVGIYSNATYWQQIVGRWLSLSVPEWIATGAPDPPGCPAGFAAGPVWLKQGTDGTLDLDTVC
jgi:LysM repeat protein